MVRYCERGTPRCQYQGPRGAGLPYCDGMAMPNGATHRLVEQAAAALPDLLADLEMLVCCESPSSDLDAVAASAELVAELGTKRLGAAPDRIVLDGRSHLRWRLGESERRVLLLCHHDTVWPLGSLTSKPYSVADGVVRGPGCFDMKAGLVMAMHAVTAIDDPAGVTVLVTGDEELGSPSSRKLIEQEAAGCVATLVLEASADGGALKVERKGVSLYEVAVTGRASHAGLEPEAGVNATIELAHQVLAVAALGDAHRGTTVTPTVLTSGTATNTVPASGRFAVDVRVRDAVEQARIDEAMRALRPRLAGASLTVTGGPNRPPLERSASLSLYALAEELAGELGIAPLGSAAVGGASDGNFTAAIGTPTLDGLGAVGGGAHADHEHVLVDELPWRLALVTALVSALLAGRDLGAGEHPSGAQQA
jgi:glutamate carboxypeptidase